MHSDRKYLGDVAVRFDTIVPNENELPKYVVLQLRERLGSV